MGCGQQKQDTDEPILAEDLYTSSYFKCKKRYAESVSRPGTDGPEGTPGWTILSAKHDVLWPHIAVEPYDCTIADLEDQPAPVEPDAYQHTRYPWDEPLYETRLDFWTRRVHYGLASWLGFKSGFPEEDPHCDQLIVLVGDQYVDPLLEHDVFDPFPWETTFPFQEHDFDGLGEQMAWLNAAVERVEEYMDDTAANTGTQVPIDHWRDRPDTEGQTAWGDWTQ